MLTVKEFRDLGVEYVDGDVCREIFNKHWWKSATSTFDGEVVTYFAWRTLNTMPDRPKFLCDIDYDNHTWRPSLDQSGVKDIKSRGELMSKLKLLSGGFKHYEDDEMATQRPVFTQAMADVGELPPVGVLVQIRRLLSGDSEFYNGKVIASNAGTVWFCCDKYGDRLYDEDEVEFRPLDTRTPKQKAVDDAEKVITNKVPTVSIALAKEVIGALYDAGLLKQ